MRKPVLRSSAWIVLMIIIAALGVVSSPRDCFGELRINKFRQIARTLVELEGRTDLPNGAVIMVAYGFPWNSPELKHERETGQQLAVGDTALVKNGIFTADLYFDPRWEAYRGEWAVDLTFSPANQDRADLLTRLNVERLVGANGEHLSGPHLQERHDLPKRPAYKWLSVQFTLHMSR